MKRILSLFLIMFSLFLLCSCTVAERFTSATEDTVKKLPKSTYESTVETEGETPDTEYTAGVGDKISVKGISAGGILDYFAEVAFGAEYSEGGYDEGICRFEKEILVRIFGNPKAGDVELIEHMVDTLSSFDGFCGIRFAEDGEEENLQVHFISQAKLQEMFPSSDSYSFGIAEYTWNNETYEIQRARCAVAAEEERERSATVCEEFLQSLGVGCDSHAYPYSVFYQDLCTAKKPHDIDWAVMKILYSPTLKCKMSKTEALSAAVNLVEW